MHIPTIYLKILTSSSDSYDGVAFLFPCQGALLQKGKGERPIGVVRVDDRILQRAMIEMLMTVKSLKVAINNPNSFGGNEDSGARKAIGVLNEKLKGEAEYYIKNRYKEFFWDNSSPKCFKCRF